MQLKNIGFGFLIAATLIAPSLAHADTTVVRDRFSDQIEGAGPDLILMPGLAPSLHIIMFDQPAKFDTALDSFLAP